MPAINHLTCFSRYQSTLTGYPCQGRHVESVHIDLPYAAFTPTSASSNQVQSFSWTQYDGDLDVDLLEPITVSAAMPCLPDLGMTTHLRYLDEGGCVQSIPCARWPPSTGRTSLTAVSMESVDPTPLFPSSAAPSFLPLVEAAMRSGADLTPWRERLARLKSPPIANLKKKKKNCDYLTTVDLPHGLMSIEGAILGESLLHATVVSVLC